MRDAIGIHVEHAIAHTFDHNNPSKTVISEVELPLKAEPKLQKYLDDQVMNAFDPAAGAAKFSPERESIAAGLCYGIITDSRRLVPNSRRLAELLFGIMTKNKNIAAGSFVISLFSAANYPGKKFLALIKIDPSEVLIRKVNKKKKLVSFEPSDDAMPSVREKLQKAALIQPKRRGAEYDLLLLDRQTADKVAADFFAKKFLNAAPTLDAHQRTDIFYNSVNSACKKLFYPPDKQSPLTSEQAEMILLQCDAAVKSKHIVVDEWVENLDFPDADNAAVIDIKQQITKEIKDNLPDLDFAVEPKYAEKHLTPKHRLRGESGVAIEWNAGTEKTVFPDGLPIGSDTSEDESREVVFQIRVRNPRWVK